MIDEIRKRLQRVPFVPFSVGTSDGHEYGVASVDHAHISPRGNRVVVFDDEGDERRAWTASHQRRNREKRRIAPGGSGIRGSATALDLTLTSRPRNTSALLRCVNESVRWPADFQFRRRRFFSAANFVMKPSPRPRRSSPDPNAGIRASRRQRDSARAQCLTKSSHPEFVIVDLGICEKRAGLVPSSSSSGVPEPVRVFSSCCSACAGLSRNSA